jgi:hypothetical protein
MIFVTLFVILQVPYLVQIIKTDTIIKIIVKDCKTKRDAFHGVKNKYKTDKSDETKFVLKEKSKDFTRELNKRFRIYQEKCADELRSHSKTDTKSFWKTLKKVSGNSKRNPLSPLILCMNTSRN